MGGLVLSKSISDVVFRKFEEVSLPSKKELPQGVLCVVQGPCMEIENVNQNNRFYPRELIMSRILNDEPTQHLIKCHSLLGEGCHPEDRFDVHYPNVGFSVEKLWIPEDDQDHLWGRFAILDTPVGRILNTLVKYGSNIGVSARAAGDAEVREGVEYLIPETYQFFTFDAVPDPGFKSARPTLLEGKSVPVKGFEDYTDEELKITKRVMESANKDFFAKELEDIDHRLVNSASILEASQRRIFELERTLESLEREKAQTCRISVIPKSVVETAKRLQAESAANKTRAESLEAALAEERKSSSAMRRKYEEQISSMRGELAKKPKVQILEKRVDVTDHDAIKKLENRVHEASTRAVGLERELREANILLLSSRTGLSESRVRSLVPEGRVDVPSVEKSLRKIARTEGSPIQKNAVMEPYDESNDRLYGLVAAQLNSRGVN